MKRLAFFLIAFLSSFMLNAQNVVRKGKAFVQQPTERQIQKDEPIKTDYTFTTSQGDTYPIYLSLKGKAFIIRTSKKTGNEYKQYLPEVTKTFEEDGTTQKLLSKKGKS